MTTLTKRSRVGFATATLAVLTLATVAAAANRVDKPRYDRCEAAPAGQPAGLGDEAQPATLLISAASGPVSGSALGDRSGWTGVCRERVKCWASVHATPETFEAYCAAESGRTCPEALSCVWDTLDLQRISSRKPVALGTNEHLLTAKIVAFDTRTVTVRARGVTFRVARAQLGTGRARTLDEGQSILLHFTDDQMLATGVWRSPAGQVSRGSETSGRGRLDPALEVDRLALITEGDHGRSHVIKVVE